MSSEWAAARMEGSLESSSELTVPHGGGSVIREREVPSMVDDHRLLIGSTEAAISSGLDPVLQGPSSSEKGSGKGELEGWGTVVSESSPVG